MWSRTTLKFVNSTEGGEILLQSVLSAHGLGWFDLNFECSTVCPILPGLIRIWQRWLGSWTRRWNTQINVNPSQVHEQMGHPVCTTSVAKVTV